MKHMIRKLDHCFLNQDVIVFYWCVTRELNVKDLGFQFDFFKYLILQNACYFVRYSLEKMLLKFQDLFHGGEVCDREYYGGSIQRIVFIVTGSKISGDPKKSYQIIKPLNKFIKNRITRHFA